MTRVNNDDRLSIYKLSIYIYIYIYIYIVRHVSHQKKKNTEDGLICRLVPQAVN